LARNFLELQSQKRILLFLALIYTFIRYYTYAFKYHALLFESWSRKLLCDDFFLDYDYHAELMDGLIVDKFPMGDGYYNYIRKESNSVDTKYEYKGILRRYLVYSWKDRNDDGTETVILNEYIQFKSKWFKWANNKLRKPGLLIPKIIKKELYYQLRSYLQDREQLDLLAPYILALFAISCQFYSSNINSFLGITS